MSYTDFRRRSARPDPVGPAPQPNTPPRPNQPRPIQPEQPQQPDQPGTNNGGDIIKFKVSNGKSRKLRDLVAFGLPSSKARALRNRFTPKFKGGRFSLGVPELDDSVYSELKIVKRSTATKEKVDKREADWRNVQFKVLDVVRPLLFIWQSTNDQETKKAAKAAIRLWGHAHFSLTSFRRKNVLKQTHPKFLSLLKKEKNFNKKELDALFGDTFLGQMVKAARDENTLRAATGRRGGPNLRSERGNRGRGGSNRGGHNSFPNNGSNADPDNSSGGQSGRGHQGGERNGFQNQRYLSFFPHVECAQPVGGRLKFFADNWLLVSKDPWILEVVSNGLKIDFSSEPVQTFLPRTVTLSDKETEICDQEIASLLAKNAISLSQEPQASSFLSSFFIIPKKGGKFRPVHNLKALNRFVVYRHFKMEGSGMLKHLVRQGDWFVKIDLKDAYLTVPIHPSHHRFLQLQWRDVLYQFTCLPFGLSSAPWAFTKLLKPVVAYLRKRGIRLIIYLDDMLIIGSDRASLIRDFQFVKSLLESLGFLVNMEKSVGTPAQQMEFLGLIVNSVDLSVSIPKDKLESIMQLCTDALSKVNISIREIAVILGKFAWATLAVPFAQAHYRALQSYYITSSRVFDLKALVCLPDPAREDLSWWVKNLSSCNGKPLRQNDPDLIIYSDASLSGWGGCCNGVTARGPWTSTDRLKHINELELTAAFHCIRSFASCAAGMSILLQLDNASAVAYINKRGGSRSDKLNRVALEIINWCENRRLDVQAVYLPGCLNFIADRESRRETDSSDWRLSPAIFSSLASKWEMSLDLFASAWNTQLESFVSWFPQPGALRMNAMAFRWTGLKAYAFPPFALIKDCLFKLRQEQAEIVLICPLWPSQPWFPLLLELAVEIPFILSPSQELLVSAEGLPHPLVESGSIILTAWKLSGVTTRTRAFRQEWSTCSWREFVQPHNLLTNQPGRLGVIGVFNGVPIPCQLL